MTLKAILEDLVAGHGWPWLADALPIRCFTHDPTIGSSLKFLRQTPWARDKLERLYVRDQRRVKRNKRRKWRAAAKRAHDAATDTAEDAPPEEQAS